MRRASEEAEQSRGHAADWTFAETHCVACRGALAGTGVAGMGTARSPRVVSGADAAYTSETPDSCHVLDRF